MPDGDQTPIISWRQLIQSSGQFVMTFAGTLLTLLTANNEPITGRQYAVAALTALMAAGGMLGLKYLPPKE